MLQLLFLVGALSAGIVPSQGRFLIADELPAGIVFLDADTVSRQDDRATAMIIVAFKDPVSWDGKTARFAQYVHEFDCASGRSRELSAASFTEGGETVEPEQPGDGNWSTPEPTSPKASVQANLCSGKRLPEAGADLMAVLRAYWRRVTPTI